MAKLTTLQPLDLQQKNSLRQKGWRFFIAVMSLQLIFLFLASCWQAF